MGTSCLRSRIALVALLLVPVSIADAQITGVGAMGHITFKSGFAPFDQPPGNVTTPRIAPPARDYTPIAVPGGIFLERWHFLPLEGFATGGTALYVSVPNPFSGPVFFVPGNSYLTQGRFASCTLPATMDTHFDAYVDIGPAGLPGFFTQIFYPLVGRVAGGAGSYVAFSARLHYVVRDRPTPMNPNPVPTDLGIIRVAYVNRTPGAFFAVPLFSPALFIPPTAPNRQLAIWGDLNWTVRSCPGPDAGSNMGEICVNLPAGTPPMHDPGIPDLGEDPTIFMLMTDPPVSPMGPMEEIIGQIDGNNRPVLDAIDVQVVSAGNLLSFMAQANDPDLGQMVTYGLGGGSPGSIDPMTGAFSWTPPSPGMFTVEVTATDNGSPPASSSQSVVVIVTGTNLPPSIAPVSGQTLAEETPFSLQIAAMDPNAGDMLAYSIEQGPPWLSVSPTGLLSGMPGESDGPRYDDVRVRVMDNGSPPLWCEVSFSITVDEVNQPPDFQPLCLLIFTPGNANSAPIVAIDPDRRPGPDPMLLLEPLHYSLITAPAGASIDPQTGVLSWTPSAGQIGAHPVVAKVEDLSGASDTRAFTILVSSTGPFSSRPTNCGSLMLTPSGSPVRGGSVGYALSGHLGAAVLWFGPATNVPLCPPATCIVGAFYQIGLGTTSSILVPIPNDPLLCGFTYSIQGGSLLDPAGCFATFALSNTIDTTIG